MSRVHLLLAACVLLRAQSVEFNRDIRPILSDKCFTCHGPDAANRKTPLRFDIEESAKADLGKGRFAIVPGRPEASEVIRRITSDNLAIRMPPAYSGAERLSDREIALIRRWIEQGARWEKHWSLIPPKRPEPPKFSSNPVDAFVLARLEREGLRPSPEAGKATLIRRVTRDLTGLPPTPAEVDAFLGDPSPGAYEKVVDRLLASPRYAERMAIRWLEAARYADTNGYQTDGERDMWRWRDWVIDAFHRNLPFDRFTIEQIAGDLLPNATADQIIATGFHRNHRTSGEGGIVPEEFRVEYVAERAETTATVWLGLTLGCARCHDHKYDPVSQRDFYRFFAYFNNIPEKGLVYNFGNEEPFIKAPTPEMRWRLEELERQVAQAEARWIALQPALEKAQRRWEKSLRKAPPIHWTVTEGQILHLPLEKSARFDGDHVVEAGDVANFNYQDPFTLSAWIHPTAADGAILTRIEDYFEAEGYGLYLVGGKVRLVVTKRFTDIGLRVETEQPIELNRWQHVLATYDGRRYAAGVRIYIDGKEQELSVLFDDLNFPLGSKEPFRVGGGGGLRFHGGIHDVRAHKVALTPEQAAAAPVLDTVNQLAAIRPKKRTPAQAAKLRLCFLEQAAPEEIRQAQTAVLEARATRQRYLDSLPTVMVMKESPTPRETFLLRRGAYDDPGEKVTPGLPPVLPPLEPGWPNNRLGLARWLVSPRNPLTARVTVNRFWQMYFGAGLVETVEDFGSQGDWPMHPELLDWLAVEFMESGWDVKKLQKTIVMSATYRQSSKVTPELLVRDPENRLLARGARFRLPAEMIRDQALFVSGLLAEKTGGPSAKPYQPPGLWQELAGGRGYQPDKGEGLYRRSLYTYWKRTVAPPAMITFDAPNRETCAVREIRTNTPLQALNLMNDVAYVEAARNLAARMLREGGPSSEERLSHGYRLVLSRAPGAEEAGVLAGALHAFRSFYERDRKAAEKFLAQGESPLDGALDAAELAAFTGVASLMLNLDEAITKE